MKLSKKDLEIKQEVEKDETIRPIHLEGHKPTSRRDFFAQGFLGMSAFAMAPSVLTMLSSQSARAATGCAPTVFDSLTPVIIIDLAGGGNIAGSNVMVGGAGGQKDYLSTYDTLGLPTNFHPSTFGVDEEMGLVFHKDSAILRGIRATAVQTTRANVEGAVFCTVSNDDTGNNELNPLYWLNKAGANGQLNQLAGTQQSVSGGNSQPPAASINPTLAPVRLASNQDAINLVNLGTTISSFSSDKVQKILQNMSSMSQRKIAAISRRSLPDQIASLVGCGFENTAPQISKFTQMAIDPAQDLMVTQAMSTVTNTTIRARIAPIAKLVLDGMIGVGTISLGGYDYHSGNRSDGETRDEELGQTIGAIFQLAALKQKDVVIYVFTDGGLASNQTVDNSTAGRGKFGWGGDNGTRSSTFMMVYKKDGKPALRTQNRQIGYFRPSGSVETNAALTSNSVVNTSKAMVANYLALHSKEGNLESVVGDNPFVNEGLDKYLVFDKIR